MLVAGFQLSAVLVAALGAVASGQVEQFAGLPLREVMLLVTLGLLAAADAGIGGMRPPMVRRQTPKDRVGLPAWLRGLIWGLDTGTMVSTFRTSTATWAALTWLLLLGGPWWVGAAYAAAFCLPLVLWVSVPERFLHRKALDGVIEPDSVAVTMRLAGGRTTARGLGVATMALGAGALLFGS